MGPTALLPVRRKCALRETCEDKLRFRANWNSEISTSGALYQKTAGRDAVGRRTEKRVAATDSKFKLLYSHQIANKRNN
jgi:hypothetical protein